MRNIVGDEVPRVNDELWRKESDEQGQIESRGLAEKNACTQLFTTGNKLLHYDHTTGTSSQPSSYHQLKPFLH